MAQSTGMKQLLFISAMVVLGGCGTAEPAKLTAKQVEELLAAGIGKWESTGQYRPANGPTQNTRILSEVRWKEKSKSTQFSEFQTEPVEVNSVGGREYDAARGIFILRHKEGNKPMKVAVERYDPATRTFRSKGGLPGVLPENWSVETAWQQIDEDTWKWTMKVFENDRLDFSSEQVARRISE